ncbi:MAG TPA: VTT domain-containing protein [Acetobacteraceae bacterium]|nr:VTT domain-containing protein [Acetobacteraceae bacterium]
MSTVSRVAARLAPRLPLAIAVLMAVTFISLAGKRYLNLSTLAANAKWMREMAQQWWLLAPILFVAANAALLMSLVIPAWFCTIAGGLLFGRWQGIVYALIGTTLGAAGVFLAARFGLQGLGESPGKRAKQIAEGFRANAFSYLVVLRLVPIFPFTLVNIAAAISGIPPRTYILGSLVGITPSTLIYASLGDMLSEIAQHDQLPDANLMLEPRFLIPLLGLACLALLPVLFGRLGRGQSR